MEGRLPKDAVGSHIIFWRVSAQLESRTNYCFRPAHPLKEVPRAHSLPGCRDVRLPHDCELHVQDDTQASDRGL
eukprot:scaffold158408_cov27-Tisochrysis_lutea.AAC.1